MYFDNSIFLLDYEARDKNDVLNRMSDEFIQRKLVKESFKEAIIARENVFPTGMSVNGIGIAIPHTDIEQVYISQIGIARLKDEVIFNEMGNDENQVNIKLVFMLALQKPHEQITILQKLIFLFQNKEFISDICECKNTEEMLDILKKYELRKREET